MPEFLLNCLLKDNLIEHLRFQSLFPRNSYSQHCKYRSYKAGCGLIYGWISWIYLYQIGVYKMGHLQ